MAAVFIAVVTFSGYSEMQDWETATGTAGPQSPRASGALQGS